MKKFYLSDSLNRLLFLVALGFSLVTYGQSATDTISSFPKDTIISDPIAVDSLMIFPTIPHEGDTIRLLAGTTHAASSCGLLDYKVYSTDVSRYKLYIIAHYWQGMLTALCHSLDYMVIGNLQAGQYTLNFMNKRTITFTVYPRQSCKADFTFDYLRCSGTARCLNSVAFTNKSIGQNLKLRWNFGDSTFSSQTNPVYTYKNPGTYNVCLTVTDSITSQCSDYKCQLVSFGTTNCNTYFKYQIIKDSLDSISASTVAPLSSYLVRFTDYSTGGTVKWLWDFGDSTFSTEQNPVHRYRANIFTVSFKKVTLKTVSMFGCESSYSEDLVLFDSIPACKFTGTVRDYSNIDSCGLIIELDNGIKLKPIDILPNCILRDSQRVILAYRPLLNAVTTNCGLPCVITCIREITSPFCSATFTYVKDTRVKCLNCAVYQFYGISNSVGVRWNWSFGDGSTSNVQNPSHTYYVPKTDSVLYTVCLTITTADSCTSTYCQTIFIQKPVPSVPWVPVIAGDNNHSIFVPAYLSSDANLEFGDYIGLFFKNYAGDLICGGMIKWEGKNEVLTAWEATHFYDSIPVITNSSVPPSLYWKNGFRNGEKFEYKIWKWRTNQEINVQRALYTINKTFSDSGFYRNDGLSVLRAFHLGKNQTIPLYKGWNMVSLNVHPMKPGDASMSKIFGSKNVVVKNYKGEIVYFPEMGIGNGYWNTLEGYKVKSLDSTILTVTGTDINPQTTISFPDNLHPYFLPYYYNVAHPIKSMLALINGYIRYVQTFEYINGKVQARNYIPKYNIDQIKTMKPGLAYKLSLTEGLGSFTYPLAPNDSTPCCYYSWNGTGADNKSWSESNRVFVIPQQYLNISKNAKIYAYTRENVLVGQETSEGGNVAITLWDLQGESEYNNFILKVSDNDLTQNYEINLATDAESDGDLKILNKKVVTGTNYLVSKDDIRAYPTVTSQDFYIDVNFDCASSIEVSFYNLLGKKLKQTEFKNVSAGSNQLKVDVGNLNSGQYIYHVKTDKQFYSGKLQVAK
jgi:PKD repeat protein